MSDTHEPVTDEQAAEWHSLSLIDRQIVTIAMEHFDDDCGKDEYAVTAKACGKSLLGILANVLKENAALLAGRERFHGHMKDAAEIKRDFELFMEEGPEYDPKRRSMDWHDGFNAAYTHHIRDFVTALAAGSESGWEELLRDWGEADRNVKRLTDENAALKAERERLAKALGESVSLGNRTVNVLGGTE